MSQTATPFDVKADLLGRLDYTCKRYIEDLAHIPADKLGVSPMGTARTPLAFTAECIGFNSLLAGSLSGAAAEMPSEEEIKAFVASVDSFEKAKSMLEMSCSKLANALEPMSMEELAATIQAPWGDSMTKLSLCEIAVSHMVYHDGQINYIQTLYGDSTDYWMGE